MATPSWQQKRPEQDDGGPVKPGDVSPIRDERTAGAGSVLRQAREEMGWSIQQVGQTLKIRPEYLDAFERNSLEGLPGPAYAMGFLKTYADFLNLDTGEIVRRFKAEKSGLGRRPELTFPVPLTDRGLPGGGLFLTALILIALGYGTWYYMSSGRHSTPPAVEAVPSQLLNPPPPPAASQQIAASTSATSSAIAGSSLMARPNGAAGTPAMESTTTTAPALAPPQDAAGAPPASEAPRPSQENVPSTASPAAPAANPIKSAAESNAATDPDALGPHNYGQTSVAHIVLRANADAWVQVKENGLPIFTRVLKAGDSYNVPDRPGLVMRTGNAGGIDITADGKAVPPLGVKGQVKGNIQLDLTKLTAQASH